MSRRRGPRGSEQRHARRHRQRRALRGGGRRRRASFSPRPARSTATPAQLPVAETAPPRPLSPYAAAKLAAEEACAAAADAGQLTAVCLRFFNVYGPRQDPRPEYSGVISRFMSAAAAGDAGDRLRRRQQTRDFVYVGDVADALTLGLLKPLSGVASPTSARAQTSVLDILDALEGLGGRRCRARASPPAATGDIRDSRADVGRAALGARLAGRRRASPTACTHLGVVSAAGRMPRGAACLAAARSRVGARAGRRRRRRSPCSR